MRHHHTQRACLGQKSQQETVAQPGRVIVSPTQPIAARKPPSCIPLTRNSKVAFASGRNMGPRALTRLRRESGLSSGAGGILIDPGHSLRGLPSLQPAERKMPSEGPVRSGVRAGAACWEYLTQELWGECPPIHRGCLLDHLFGLFDSPSDQEPPRRFWQKPAGQEWL